MISLGVFGYYNFRKKARFFAGDIGSICIAVLLFFMGGTLLYQLQAPVIILLVVVYGADSMITIANRTRMGQNIVEPHRMHLYQKLVDIYGVSHLKVASMYAMLQMLVNILVFKTYTAPINMQYTILFSVIGLFFLTYVILFYYIEKRKNSLA